MGQLDPFRHATVTETGKSSYAVAIEVSGHRIMGDEPLASGGNDLGPSPYDLLLASLGECTAMTVRWYALQQKWPLDKVVVRLTHHKENKIDRFTKDVTLTGDILTNDQRLKLIEVAGKCPIQRTLELSPLIVTTVA